MRKFLTAAMAMALILPGSAKAATDGTLGATSTGTFDMSMQVNPPTGVVVRIWGLTDVNFGSVATTNNQTTSVAERSTNFCAGTTDTAGNIRIVFSQGGVSNGNYFRLNGTGGAADFIETNIVLDAWTGPSSSPSSFTPYVGTALTVRATEGAGCVGSTNSHRLRVQPLQLPAYQTKPLTGAYSGTVTLTISAP